VDGIPTQTVITGVGPSIWCVFPCDEQTDGVASCGVGRVSCRGHRLSYRGWWKRTFPFLCLAVVETLGEGGFYGERLECVVQDPLQAHCQKGDDWGDIPNDLQDPQDVGGIFGQILADYWGESVIL
jgi:hypothetical protein